MAAQRHPVHTIPRRVALLHAQIREQIGANNGAERIGVDCAQAGHEAAVVKLLCCCDA